MKDLTIYTILGLLALLSGCQSESAPPPQQSFDPTPWLEKGSRVQAATFAVLSTRLKSAMSQSGVNGAIRYCNLAATPLMDTLSAKYDCRIRRTTLQPRNLANLANDHESAILASWAAELAKGVEPQAVVQNLSPDTVLYYAPIRMQALCLNCHGKIGEGMTEETQQLIRELYPTDQATGYAFGDLRGMWSIRFLNR